MRWSSHQPAPRPSVSPHDPRIFFQLLLTKTFPDRLVARKLTKGHGEVGWRWQDTGPEARPLHLVAPKGPWACWNWRFFMGQMTRCWMNQLKQMLTPVAWWGFLPSHGCLHHPIFARHIYRRTLGRKKKKLSLPPLQDLLCVFLYILPVEPTCFPKNKHWHHPGTGLQGHNQSSRVAQLFHVPGEFCLGFFGHQQVRDNSDTSHEALQS